MTLYIVGNGFDLAHGMETSYCHYKDFVKSNLKRHYQWDIILDFYPEDYEFWSDIELNVCKINKKHYLSLSKLFGFGFLDDLLRQIHNSFEAFILNRETTIFTLKPKFTFDDNAFYFTFNYTSVLEDVYKIERSQIIYIHNDIAGPAMEILYNVSNHTPCVIGHSPVEQDFSVHNELLIDKEYSDFVKSTTKNCYDVLKQKGVITFLENNKDVIDKVVFYGFSFSITDKLYVKTIFDNLDTGKTAFSIYYIVPNDNSAQTYLASFKSKVKDCGVNLDNVIFVNCEGITAL